MKLKRLAIAAASATAVVGLVVAGLFGAGSLAQAQTPGDKSSRWERHDQLMAEKLGVTVEQLRAARKAASDQMIDEALARGAITAEQAQRLKERSGGPPFGPPFLGRMGERVKAGVVSIIDAAAKVLGVSSDQVRDGLRNGQSLAQQAQNKGISRDALKSGMQAEILAKIQEAQAAGRITAEQANRLRDGLSEQLDRAIDRVPGDGKGIGPRGPMRNMERRLR